MHLGLALLNSLSSSLFHVWSSERPVGGTHTQDMLFSWQSTSPRGQAYCTGTLLLSHLLRLLWPKQSHLADLSIRGQGVYSAHGGRKTVEHLLNDNANCDTLQACSASEPFNLLSPLSAVFMSLPPIIHFSTMGYFLVEAFEGLWSWLYKLVIHSLQNLVLSFPSYFITTWRYTTYLVSLWGRGPAAFTEVFQYLEQNLSHSKCSISICHLASSPVLTCLEA